MNLKLDTPQKIVNNILSGNAHYQAWCSVVSAIEEVAPEVLTQDSSKSAVELICNWIREQKKVGE
jgi:hypothetical protein